MQEKRFLIKRFREYLILFMVPVVLAIVLTSFLTLRMVLGNARERNMTVVQEVNSNIGMSLSAILQQNSQFANNPYMLLSLRRILMDSDNIRYADSINLRSLNASLQSIQVTFPYIDNVRLYLDGIDFCYKSNQTIEKVNKEAAWYKGYRRMDQSQAAMAERLPETAGQTGEKLVLYQRLPYYHGAVIMTVNLDRFKEQLRRSIEIDETQSIVFINSRGEELFVWGRGDKNLESAGTFPETADVAAIPPMNLAFPWPNSGAVGNSTTIKSPVAAAIPGYLQRNLVVMAVLEFPKTTACLTLPLWMPFWRKPERRRSPCPAWCLWTPTTLILLASAAATSAKWTANLAWYHSAPTT